MGSFLYTVVAFILGLGILVTVHEFGHFWVARRLGIRVLRFSIGFGKPLLTWHDKTGTEYIIAMLPLGGYVKMLDGREGTVLPAEIQFAFDKRPVMHRIAVVIAGPLFNMIFAVFAYWMMFMIGIKGITPTVGNVVEDSIAYDAGIRSGQVIQSIDGVHTPSWQAVVRQLVARLGEESQMRVVTQFPNTSTTQSYTLDLRGWEVDPDKPDVAGSIGLKLFTPEIPAVFGEVIPGEAAEAAGLKVGDKVLKVDGHLVRDWLAFVAVMRDAPEQPKQVTVMRDGSTLTRTVKPKLKTDNAGNTVGFVGVMVKPVTFPPGYVKTLKYGPIQSIGKAFKHTYMYTALTLNVMKKMVLGQVSLRNLSGPISIAKGAGQTARIGLEYFLGFLALISISLAVINILPIPVLDGGHLMYYLIELVRRRPVSEATQILGFRIGLVFLLCLMGISFYNDILRL